MDDEDRHRLTCLPAVRGGFFLPAMNSARLEGEGVAMKKLGKKVILDAKGMDRVLSRVTHEILEKNRGAEDIALVGICSGGVPLSRKIQEKIRAIEGVEVPAGYVDITLYRDDLSRAGYQPRLKRTEIPFSIDEKKVILVDDVLFTGRTIRAAMDALIDFGRPRNIQLAVLIDRGHRELPIRADYVGRNVPTSRSETVEVMIQGEPDAWKVVLNEGPAEKEG